LNKVSKNQILSTFEQKEYDTFVSYVDYLCQAAFKNNLPILIDAEYASMQNAIDQVLWK
jgi:DNA polymerase IIIc chi subunit